MATEEERDVVIVGAGVAGIDCRARMLRHPARHRGVRDRHPSGRATGRDRPLHPQRRRWLLPDGARYGTRWNSRRPSSVPGWSSRSRSRRSIWRPSCRSRRSGGAGPSGGAGHGDERPATAGRPRRRVQRRRQVPDRGRPGTILRTPRRRHRRRRQRCARRAGTGQERVHGDARAPVTGVDGARRHRRAREGRAPDRGPARVGARHAGRRRALPRGDAEGPTARCVVSPPAASSSRSARAALATASPSARARPRRRHRRRSRTPDVRPRRRLRRRRRRQRRLSTGGRRAGPGIAAARSVLRHLQGRR